MSDVFCRAVAVVSIALTFTACTRSVDVPRDQLSSAASVESATHEIKLTDGTSYIARKFSVTDSTVLIEKLNGSDLRFKTAKLPVVVPLNDVESVAKLETRKGPTTAIVVTGAVLLAGLIFLTNWNWGEGLEGD